MSDRLRVLHVIVSDQFAGVEQFVLRLALQQVADGHEVRVAGGDPDVLAGALRAAGARFAPARGISEAIRAIRASDAQVVNSHMTAADIAAIGARMLGRRHPALVSTRHFALRRGTRGPAGVYRAIERLLDAEIAISHAVANAIGVPSTVVHSGIDTPPLSGAPRERTVLMAQRLQPEKRTDVGIRAFAASGIAADGWTLEIAGVGPLGPELVSLADRLGVSESVRLLGFRHDLPERMQRAGMLLATTPNEGLGLTVMEAMGAALPVVAVDAGGYTELLSGVEGAELFPADDAGAAAHRLRGLADDSAARDKLGRAQRARQAKAFTLRAQADGTAAVYRSVLNRRGAQ